MSQSSLAAEPKKSKFVLRIFLSALSEKKLLEKEDHLVISCTIVDNENEILSYTMIDNDATKFVFIDENYARCKSLLLHKLKKPRDLEVFDGRLMMSDDITHIAKAQLKIGQHTKVLPLFVIKLEHYSMILENL